MFLPRSFQEFLVLHSEAEPMPTVQPHPEPAPHGEDGEPSPPRRVIDWRWLEGHDVP